MCGVEGRARSDAVVAVDSEHRCVERAVVQRAQHEDVLWMLSEIRMVTPRKDVCEVQEVILSNPGHRARVAIPVRPFLAEAIAHDGFGCFVAANSPALIEDLTSRSLCDLTGLDPTRLDVWATVVTVHPDAVV